MEEARKQRHSTNSQNQIQSPTIDQKNRESDYRQPSRQSRDYVIEMTRDYPFGQPCPDNCTKLVKHTRHFRPAEYPELSRQIQASLQLKHPNLLSIVKAFQSKKNSFFQLYYQYVPENIETALGGLQKQEIIDSRNRLSDLCKYLILNNIDPEVSVRNIGFKNKTIKYYLDIQKIDSKNLVNKKQAATLKEIQIRSLFTSLLRKRNSDPNKITRGSNNIRSHEIMANATSGSFLGFTEQEPRNSSLTNMNRKSTQLDSQRNVLDVNKIRFIDDRIKQLKLNMNKKPKPYRQSTTSNVVLNDSAFARNQQQSPPAPSNDMLRMVHQYMQAHQYAIRDGRDQQMELPALEFAVNRCDDEDSIDTYNQELGEEPEIPKITHQQMRQTTKSPPHIVFRDKLHESVGNTRFNLIRQSALAKDTNTLRDLDLSPKSQASRHVSVQEPQRLPIKSASSSEYFENKKQQSMNDSKKYPEHSLKKSVAVSRRSNSKSRKTIEDHIQQIRIVQREISMRKLNSKKSDEKRYQQRKFTEPKCRKANDEKIEGIMKYYSFETDLQDEFNDIFQCGSTTKPTDSHERLDSAGGHRRLEINERVKLALKKSEATLESIRHKMGVNLK